MPRPIAYFLAGLGGAGSDTAFGLAWPVARALFAGTDARREAPATGFHPLAAALHRDMTRATLPVLLRYGDRNSMAHSREVRLPFCDHRLAEFVFSLPPTHLMGGAETKRLLRGALKGVVPEAIRTRWNKQGFMPPHADWLKGALGGSLRSILDDPGFGASGFWRASWWRAILARFERGETALAATLWRPFIEHAWRTHFVARIARMPVLPVFAEPS